MKLKLDDGTKLKFKLERDDYGTVDLTVSNNDGDEFYLIGFKTDGRVIRYNAVIINGITVNQDGQLEFD